MNNAMFFLIILVLSIVNLNETITVFCSTDILILISLLLVY